MTEQRKGEIALLYLKAKFQDEGIRLKPDMRRQIGNEAAKIGVKPEEAEQFIEELVREMVEKIFPPRATSHHNPEYTKRMQKARVNRKVPKGVIPTRPQGLVGG